MTSTARVLAWTIQQHPRQAGELGQPESRRLPGNAVLGRAFSQRHRQRASSSIRSFGGGWRRTTNPPASPYTSFTYLQDPMDDAGRRRRRRAAIAGSSGRRERGGRRRNSAVARNSPLFAIEGERCAVSAGEKKTAGIRSGGIGVFWRETSTFGGSLGGKRRQSKALVGGATGRSENDKSADVAVGIWMKTRTSRGSIFVFSAMGSECATAAQTETAKAEADAVSLAGASSSASPSPRTAAVYPDLDPHATSAIAKQTEAAKHVCLFYCDETRELAKKIAAENDNIELQTVQWGRFADGFPNLFIPNAHGIRNRHVAFLASFSSPAVIFEQLSVIYALPRMFVSSFMVVLPFFPTGTVERMEDEGDIATAFTLSRILSNIPLSRGGPTSVVIFDIHALQERFYFGDYVHPFFESGVPLLKERLSQLTDFDNITIAFPDEGAWKRFYKQFSGFDTIICTKVRDGNQRIVRLKEGDPHGRHVVIVDDLVQSGSTLVECQKLLAGLGASCVSAYATHGVFPNQSWKRFVHSETEDTATGGFAHFWITDSCAETVSEVEGKRPFEILSLAKLIAAALQI